MLLCYNVKRLEFPEIKLKVTLSDKGHHESNSRYV